MSEYEKSNDPSADEPPPFPPRTQKTVSGSTVADTSLPDEPPPFPPGFHGRRMPAPAHDPAHEAPLITKESIMPNRRRRWKEMDRWEKIVAIVAISFFPVLLGVGLFAALMARLTEGGGSSTSGAGTTTADYLPHKAGSLARYDVWAYSQPETGFGMRHEYRYGDGGVIEHSLVRGWTIQNGAKGPSNYLGRPMDSERHRVNGGFVEIGSELEGVGFVWQPRLKIGARVGDRWERNLAPGYLLRYSIWQFGSYKIPINGRSYPTVSVREDIGNLSTLWTYALGIGLIHNEVYMDGRLVGKSVLDDQGIWNNLTPSERKFFE